MRRFFSKFNMHAKMITLSICIVLLTSVLLSALFYHSNMVMYEEKISVISEEAIVQAGSYINSELSHIVQLVHGGIVGYDIYDSVEEYLSSSSSVSFHIGIQEMLTQLVVQSSFIHSAKIVTDNTQIGNLMNRTSYDITPILEKAKEGNSGIYWHDTLIVDAALDKEFLVLVFYLTDSLAANFSDNVFLVVNLSYDAIERELRSMETDVFGTVRLVNQLEESFDDTSVFVDDYDYVLTAELAINGWKIQTLQNKEILFAEYYQTQKNTFAIVFGIVMLLIVVSSYFARSVIMPLRQLTWIVESMKHRDYSQHYLPSGMAEIDALGDVFNQLEDELIEYEGIVARDKARIKQEEQEKYRVELRLLQAQMNPHFLYNALDSIYWYAQQKEVEKVCSVIINLSKLLRISLSRGDEFVSLRQEVEHVEAYLKIQKQIFGQKFNYVVQMDEALSAQRIVKIILQPLVENSILHGFSNIEEGGIIVVKVFATHEDIVLQVIDNGMGFALSAMQKGEKKGSGFALVNLQKRLALYYKDSASLRQQTNADGLTQVEIRIQKIETVG